MQTAPEITIDDIPIQECVNYGSSINDSGSDSGSDFEQTSQSDLLSELEVIITFHKVLMLVLKL